ncbi:hypothetical protein E4099_23440, partial [Streptomyces palmae]
SSLCFFFKGTSSQTIRPGDGVSTNLALTFGTLLSSQGTDASFGFPLGLPPGASLRCFTLYQAISRSLTTRFLQARRSGPENWI